jgi:hypothetical protein
MPSGIYHLMNALIKDADTDLYVGTTAHHSRLHRGRTPPISVPRTAARMPARRSSARAVPPDRLTGFPPPRGR